MTLIISGDIRLAQGYTRPDDEDAAAYIAAVEAADGQPLETEVRMAINTFVKGCKADGIWDAIKASCILAGARTLDGALVPLAGTAPTNFNFVSGDYDRKTGLVGDGSTKYLDSNRAGNADPANSNHISAFVSTLSTWQASVCIATAATYIAFYPGNSQIRAVNGGAQVRNKAQATGFIANRRSASTAWQLRTAESDNDYVDPFVSQSSSNFVIFGSTPGVGAISNARIAFYSIGESLDLALLDARVTDLINKFAEVIP